MKNNLVGAQLLFKKKGSSASYILCDEGGGICYTSRVFLYLSLNPYLGVGAQVCRHYFLFAASDERIFCEPRPVLRIKFENLTILPFRVRGIKYVKKLFCVEIVVIVGQQNLHLLGTRFYPRNSHKFFFA